MLDALGERYGMLPSELLERANTFDLWVYDVAVSYINEQQRKSTSGNQPPPPGSYSQEQLRQRMERVRGNTS
jgi:hypothetical protein